MDDIYERLATFVDRLLAGFPRTESGVELRILHKLFTAEEAELFMHLTLLPEEPSVIAYRAKQPVESVCDRLDEMDKKGLVYAEHRPGKPTRYIALQWAIGFYEGSVGRIDAGLAKDVEEYKPAFLRPELWGKVPQLRTIPIGESIPILTEALPYEVAEKIIAEQTVFGVAECICEKQQRLLGKGCDKPLERCMSFGPPAENNIKNGLARKSTREEVLAILKRANEVGLVLQPTNSKNPSGMCACCGDCCGVLQLLKMHPKPADIVSSPYSVTHDDAICSGCGTCVDRCQMEAISVPDDIAQVNLDRCIGCGLCVSTCSTGALRLVRKPETRQSYVPKNITETDIRLAQARGLLTYPEMANMLVKSQIDRLSAKLTQ